MVDVGDVADSVAAFGTMGAFVTGVVLYQRDRLTRQSTQLGQIYVSPRLVGVISVADVRARASQLYLDNWKVGRPPVSEIVPWENLEEQSNLDSARHDAWELYDLIVRNGSDSPIYAPAVWVTSSRKEGARYGFEAIPVGAPSGSGIGLSSYLGLHLGVLGGGQIEPGGERLIARYARHQFEAPAPLPTLLHVTDGLGREWTRDTDGSVRRGRQYVPRRGIVGSILRIAVPHTVMIQGLELMLGDRDSPNAVDEPLNEPGGPETAHDA